MQAIPSLTDRHVPALPLPALGAVQVPGVWRWNSVTTLAPTVGGDGAPHDAATSAPVLDVPPPTSGGACCEATAWRKRLDAVQDEARRALAGTW